MILNNLNHFVLILIIVVFIFLDRFLKFIAINNIFLEQLKIIGDIFTFQFAKNYNIAFSLPLSGNFLNYFIALIIILLFYYFIILAKSKDLKAYFLALIIFGAISNFFDRLNYGFVIDYLDLKYFAIFNIADIMIVVGAVFLVIDRHSDKNIKKVNI